MPTRRSRLLAAVAAIGASLIVAYIPTAANAAPFNATLTVLAANGSGCPNGSSVMVSYPSADSVTLRYTQFQVYGGGLRNCQVVARINVPSGWSYTIPRQIDQGWAQLDAFGSATIQTSTYFSDSLYTDRNTMRLTGPYNSDFQHVAMPASEQWSICNQSHTLNINDVIQVAGPASTNTVALISKNLSASTTFFLRYRQC